MKMEVPGREKAETETWRQDDQVTEKGEGERWGVVGRGVRGRKR